MDPRLDLPPGPEAGPFAQTVALHRDPLGVLRRAQRRYGDVFTLRLLTLRPLVVVCDPAHIDDLVNADPARAHAGEARRRMLPFASARSIFGGDDRFHQDARRRVAGAFSPERMDGLAPEMSRIAARHAEAWPRSRPFRLLSRMRSVMDEIFIRLILGVRTEPTATELVAAIGRMLRTPGNPPLSLPGGGKGMAGRGGDALFRRRQAPVSEWLARAVEERRSEPEGDDLLGAMVRAVPRLSTPEIVDELLSTLMAAQEPPAIAHTWLLDRLARDRARADEFVAAPRSAGSEAVVSEILRLHPPASGILRRLTAPFEIGARLLPAGATVMVPLSVVQRDRRSFEGADEFRPERWLGLGTPSGPFLPFGGGARGCVGEPLARAEMASVTPAVLEACRLRPLSLAPERMVLRGTVVVPRRSGLVVAQDSNRRAIPRRHRTAPSGAAPQPTGVGSA